MNNIYQGIRSPEFVECIRSVLKRGKMTDKYISFILNPKGLEEYNKVFTHSSVDPANNYEYYEKLGDSTVNKSIIWYFNARYPKLRCPTGIIILSKLQSYVGSKAFLHKVGENLGFWKYITIQEEVKQRELKSTLEDVTEAFIGCTEFLINENVFPTTGYSICYNILSSLLDEMKISFKYTELVDAITRLKEIGDKNKQITKIFYDTREEKNAEGFRIFYATVQLTINGRVFSLGKGSGSKKDIAKTNAAENTIQILTKEFGIVTTYPDWEQYQK